jgi:hypothetical protein
MAGRRSYGSLTGFGVHPKGRFFTALRPNSGPYSATNVRSTWILGRTSELYDIPVGIKNVVPGDPIETKGTLRYYPTILLDSPQRDRK